ncbi:4,5-dihydroxyphthalate decarboxylase [Tsukamurella sp. 8F]|uniref:4,5-dihydroxyphthalate decarboxylase n=1 Tax=unclassified Tsukamurella TaxID=2633480 RepID=UPI0023B98676|nr:MULTISPECIES: 4,5-dihydroxyphthalate decarboxylase [unclassified Tsukamurella]MDF0530191.1 4,5-dihydroxyphthalate decarboxylase [Tsukamurella sp. 8J]MDF0586508.1 4,5-dihydroxyphthalate decarboxylase [Tsukamurella sp. 8F]
MNIDLRLGSSVHEPVEPLFDGRVTIDGVDAVFETVPLASDVFRNMIEGRYDIAELGLTYYTRLLDVPDPPFVALPVFPARNFRHSAMFINVDAGIEKPEDLVGKTIGEFGLYGCDPGVWLKGILADDYGFRPDSNRWVTGGTDFAIREFDWLPRPEVEGVDVRHAADGQTLGAMLEAGEIDALLSVDVPQSFLDGTSKKIARLFPDYERVERAYYRRTGIFPQMHVVAVRKELAGRTGLLRAVFEAFVAAKDLVQSEYLEAARKQHMEVITPWFSSLFAENRELLGEDWWPYGVRANRKAVDTFLRYHYEQGLSKRRLTSDEFFAASLLDT